MAYLQALKYILSPKKWLEELRIDPYVLEMGLECLKEICLLFVKVLIIPVVILLSPILALFIKEK